MYNNLFLGYKSDIHNLSVIYQAVNVCKPELKYLLPPREFVDAALERIVYQVDGDNIVELMLEKGVGGKKYIKSDLMSKVGHHIG